MALFGITLKKLEAIPSDISHMFGGGSSPAPRSTPTGGGANPGTNAPWQSPAQQAANAVHAPAVAQPQAYNPILNPPPSTDGSLKNKGKPLMGLMPGYVPSKPPKEDFMHNPVTNFLGNNIVKPLAQFPIDASTQIYNHTIAPMADLPKFSDPRKETGVMGAAAREAGADASLHQTIGSGIQTALTIAAPGAEGVLGKYLSESAAKKAAAIGIGSGFGASAGVTNNEDPKHIAEGAAIGAGLGALGSAVIPSAVSEIRAMTPSVKEVTAHDNTAPPAVAGKQAVQHVEQLPKPKNTPMTGQPTTTDTNFVVPKGTGVETANAAQKLSDLYDKQGPQAGDIHQLVGKMFGHNRQFSMAGDDLEAAMEKEYTPEEQIAARDNLEGVASATGATPRVQALTRVLKQLNDKGYDALDASHETDVHRVGLYATRQYLKGPATDAATDAATGAPVQSVADRLKSLLNVKNGFANNRVIHKYVASDGETRYGTQTDAGLTNKNGQLVSGKKVFKPSFVSQQELENNGYQFEKNYGKVANNYHSTVGRSHVAQQVKDELLANPEQYGLTKDVTPGYAPIRGVKELDGYFAPEKDANELEQTFSPRGMNPIEHAFQGITRGAIQSIVYNPLFHGRNLMQLAGMAAGKAKDSPFGGLIVKKGLADLAGMTEEESAALDTRMRSSPLHEETYGADRDTVLTRAADQAGLPHLSKIGSVPMAKIDWNVRKALFHLLTTGDRALDDDSAGVLINTFLGDREATNMISRNLGLFWHYMKTRLNIVKEVASHPGQNGGTVTTAAVQAATLYGMTKAFQEWTGNKHASLGHPGIFGLANQVKDVATGRGVAVATSTINPVITAALNQLYSKDLYTGQSLSGVHDRLQNAGQTLIAPAQNVGKVQEGKATVGQEAVQMLTGASTPHTSSAPAIPNAKNPLAGIINEKGAKAAPDAGKIHDPTGLDQAKLYYTAKDAALRSVGKDPLATDAINAYLDTNVNSKGDKVKKGPEQSLGVANLLAETPDALKAMQKFQKSQPQHDPMWDLNPGDLKTFLQYEGSRQETGEKGAMQILDTKFNKGQGLDKFIQQRSDYYNNNKFPAGTSLDNPDTPKYPSFQGQQDTDYQAYQTQFKDSTDGKAKAAFIQAHPDVADALLQISKYYNAQNVAQGGLAVKDNVELTPAQQQWYTWYSGLPKGTGARSSAIKGNKDMWNSITQALAQSDLLSIAKHGAIEQYAGVPYSQTFLTDIQNAAKYDIAKGSDGTYSVNPPAASASSGSGSGSSSSSAKARATTSKVIANEKAASQRRDAEHAAKAGNNLIKGVKRNAKLRGPQRLSIHMRGETKVKPFRVKGATLKPRQVAKKPAKPARALQRSNRATLKT